MTKTAMITGATAGFGAAAVRRFANAGWRVVVPVAAPTGCRS